jgi:hypothetical protein
MTYEDLLHYIQLEIVKIGTAQDAAALWGISPAYLGDVRLKKRAPGPKLLRSLGIEQEVRYRFKISPITTVSPVPRTP